MKGVGGEVLSGAPHANGGFQIVGAGFPAASAAIGVYVLIGWLTSNAFMVQMNTTVPMVITTAVVLIAMGLGGVLWSYGRYRPAFWLGVVVCGIGLASAFEYLTGVDVPIDNFDLAIDGVRNAGGGDRMSPNSTVCAILIGAALALLTYQPRSRTTFYAAGACCGLAMSIGLAAITGYLVAIPSAYSVPDLPGMAFLTATGFCLLAAAPLALLRSGGAGVESYRLTAMLVAVGVTLLGLNGWLWVALHAHNDSLMRDRADIQANWIAEEVTGQIAGVASAVQLFAARWATDYQSDEQDWRVEAQKYVMSVSGLRALVWFDENQLLRAFVHKDPKGSMQGLEQVVFGFDSLPVAAPGGTDDQPLLAVLPGYGISPARLVLRVPLSSPDGEQGFAVGLFDASDLMGPIMARHRPILVQARISNESNSLFNSEEFSESNARQPNWFSNEAIVMGIPFKIETQLLQQRIGGQSALINIVLITGLLMSVAVLAAVASLQRAQRYSRLAKDREDRWHQVVESAPSAILLTDADGLIEMVNLHCEKLFGYTRAEMTGMTVDMLVPTEMREAHRRNRREYAADPHPRAMGGGMILSGRHKDGSKLPVEVGLSPMPTVDGMKILASIADVSDREHYISELSRSNEELDRFAYIASHDLKSPLRGIAQLASWLTDDLGDSVGEESVRHLALMRRRVNRMESLLDDLLSYARLGRMDRKVTSVSLTPLLRGIVDLHVNQSGFSVNFPEDLPVIMTPKAPLQLVLRNLISNAVRHHDKEKGNISVSASRVGSKIIFEVADDGPGIEPEYREKVFELFSTLSRRDEREGSGIGLAIVLKTIESLGGEIGLHDASPRGTIVRFTWPAEMQADSPGAAKRADEATLV